MTYGSSHPSPTARKNGLQPLSYEEFKKVRRGGNSTTLIKCHQEGNKTRLLNIEEIWELQAKNEAGNEIHAKQGVLIKNGEKKRDAKDQLDLTNVFSIFEHDAGAARACEELSNGEMKGLVVCADRVPRVSILTDATGLSDHVDKTEQETKESSVILLPQEMPQQLEIDSIAGRTTLDTNDVSPDSSSKHTSTVQVQVEIDSVETPTNQVSVDDDDESEFCASNDEFSNFGATPVPNPSTQNLSPFQTAQVSNARFSGFSFTDETGEVKVLDVLSRNEHEKEAKAFKFNDGVQQDKSLTKPRIFLLRLKKNTTFKSVFKAGKKAIEVALLLRMCSSKAEERSVACLCTPMSNSAPFSPASLSVASTASSAVPVGANIGIGATPVHDAPPRVNLYGAIDYNRSRDESAADDSDELPPQPKSVNIVVDSVAVDEEDAVSLIAEAMRHDRDESTVVLVVSPRNRDHTVGAAHADALFTCDGGTSMNNIQATPVLQFERGYVLSPDSTAASEIENIFRHSSGSGSSIGSTREDESTLQHYDIGLEQASTFNDLPASPPNLLDTELVLTSSSQEGEEASPRSFIGWISSASPVESNRRKKKKEPTPSKRAPTLDSKKRGGIVTARVSDINRKLARLSSEGEYHRVSKRLGNNQQYIRSVPIGIAKSKSRDSVGSTTISLPSIKSFEGHTDLSYKCLGGSSTDDASARGQ